MVEHWPDNERAIYSQRGIILASIELDDPNAAQVATTELLDRYSAHRDFVRIVSTVAQVYSDKYQHAKARNLHSYIVANHRASAQAMWSQRSVVLASIGLKDDAATDAGIERLLKDYRNHPEIDKAAYQVARRLYHKEAERARLLYEFILEENPGSKFGLLSAVNMGGIALYAGEVDKAKDIFDDVLRGYGNTPYFAEAVNLVAEAYWEYAEHVRHEGRAEAYRANLENALREWERFLTDIPETPYHTASACFFAGECHRKLGRPAEAVERYFTLIERWPASRYAEFTHLRLASTLESLARSEQISSADAYVGISTVCRDLLERYPNGKVARAAKLILKNCEHFASEEGSDR